jgi:hypothetical protein
MRKEVTRDRLELLMQALAREAPRRGTFKVYLVGGGTAVYAGWRSASVDVDLCFDEEAVFWNIQGIKEQLSMNIEFARPEDFVPPLKGSADRHLFIETVGRVSFYHYDPYAQILSKIVRGFQRDLDDARSFLRNKMVEPGTLISLVSAIPESAYARYPNLSRRGVESAVRGFLEASAP